MPYAAQYQGDYKTYGYAGDPGFLSKLWKVAKVAARFVPGPIGMIARVAGGIGIGAAAASMLKPTPGILPPPPGQFPIMSPTPGGWGPGTRALASGPAAAQAMTQMGLPDATGCCPTGFHLRKDKKLPPKCVRNRRMNVGNARALRRGMRRVSGFEKLARRTITFTKRVRIKKRKT